MYFPLSGQRHLLAWVPATLSLVFQTRLVNFHVTFPEQNPPPLGNRCLWARESNLQSELQCVSSKWHVTCCPRRWGYHGEENRGDSASLGPCSSVCGEDRTGAATAVRPVPYGVSCQLESLTVMVWNWEVLALGSETISWMVFVLFCFWCMVLIH